MRALEKQEGLKQEQERSVGAFYESPVGAFSRVPNIESPAKAAPGDVSGSINVPRTATLVNTKLAPVIVEKRMISGSIYNEINHLAIVLTLLMVFLPARCGS